MVSDPADYRWSSYRHHALGVRNRLITANMSYLSLGESDSARQAAYREACGSSLDEGVVATMRLAFNRSQPLGNAAFVERIERTTGRVCRVRPRGRPSKAAS